MSTQAFLRGMYVGTTGDATRSRELRQEISKSQVKTYWDRVGGYLQKGTGTQGPASHRYRASWRTTNTNT